MDDLRADEKECAEHVMLVDLGRNDLGRVCVPGTVQVDELMGIELYSHVMHMVSSVSGTLAPGRRRHRRAQGGLPGRHRERRPQGARHADHRRARDGAPRPVRRRHRLPVATAATSTPASASARSIVKDGVAHVQAGAGIVADSVPAREFEETENKAAALLRAIELAHEEFADAPRSAESSGSEHEPPDRTRRDAAGLRHRQLRLVHLQPGPAPGRARRRGRRCAATTR